MTKEPEVTNLILVQKTWKMQSKLVTNRPLEKQLKTDVRRTSYMYFISN